MYGAGAIAVPSRTIITRGKSMYHQRDDNPTAQTQKRYNRIAPYYDVMERIPDRTFSRVS
jgi:hypothetical protein